MVKIIRQGVYFAEGRLIKEAQAFMTSDKKAAAVKNTVASRIISAHGGARRLGADGALCFSFAAGLRTADACGLEKFALPAYLFGGDGADGAFCLSAAKKFGADHVPLSLATPALYALERVAKSGGVYLSDEPLPVGPLGAVALVADQGDLLRALTGETAGFEPQTVAVRFRGKLRKGVGPTDVALAVIAASRKAGNFAEGKLLEIIAAEDLPMDFRVALDGALRYSGCAATVWATDEKVRAYLGALGREEDFKPLAPVRPAYYDGGIAVDLSKIEPMICTGELPPPLPFSSLPAEEGTRKSGARPAIMTVREYCEEQGPIRFDFAEITETAANYGAVAEIAELLSGKQIGAERTLCLPLPSSAVESAAISAGYYEELTDAGVVFAGEERRGIAAADGCYGEAEYLLDARTIAASMANGGQLTSALGMGGSRRIKKFAFRGAPYAGRVYYGGGKPQGGSLCYDGETFRPIPQLPALPEDLELFVGEGGERLALIAEDPGAYAWEEAIDFREAGVFAVIAERFSARQRAHFLDWGILPLTAQKLDFKRGEKILLRGVAQAVREGQEKLLVKAVTKRKTREVALVLGPLGKEERKILLAGGRNNLAK